jgi:dihydrofolate reductase
MISSIVAMAENGVIGRNNQLPWHLPADLKHFKNITSGHAILMGRKTFESIGRPLPQRTNIVLTRNERYQADGCLIAKTLEEAVALTPPHQDLFIIGGAEIYKQYLPQVQKLYLTLIHQSFSGDAYFPAIDMNDWKETSRIRHEADEAHAYAYSFVELERMLPS